MELLLALLINISASAIIKIIAQTYKDNQEGRNVSSKMRHAFHLISVDNHCLFLLFWRVYPYCFW